MREDSATPECRSDDELALDMLVPWLKSKGFDTTAAAVEDLRVQRDDADRRAGAAERRMEHLQDSAAKRSSWLRKAKAEAGYRDNVSFDRVWADALAALNTMRAQPPAWDGMAVMDDGMRTTPGYAADELKNRGMVGLTLNLRRLQEWLDAYVAHARANNQTPSPRPDEREIAP